jgi:hypothetical protein
MSSRERRGRESFSVRSQIELQFDGDIRGLKKTPDPLV